MFAGRLLLQEIVFAGRILLQDWCFAMETVLKMELPWRTMRSKLVKCDQDDDYVQYSTTFEECQIRHRYSGVSQLVRSQLAFFINLQRA